MDPRLCISPTPFSGNGVFAATPIPAQNLLLTTPPPHLSVINHAYRKETCAYCFAYNLGRHWKTRCTGLETGFVFCSDPCRELWEAEVGIVGVQAYVAVEALVRASKGGASALGEDAEGTLPPDLEDVLQAWTAVMPAAERIITLRFDIAVPRAERSKKMSRMPKEVSSAIASPNTLAFLLSGVLALQRVRDAEAAGGTVDVELQASLDMLHAAPVPYVSHLSLHAHTTSYLQLLSVLPLPLLDLVTPRNLQRIAGVAYDNAFGIRSVDSLARVQDEEQLEDPGSELLGYALYPSASLFNHSCVPNVRKARDDRVWRFWSSRDIEAGEEVCITYLGGDERSLGVQERRERLRGGWEFECACQGCT